MSLSIKKGILDLLNPASSIHLILKFYCPGSNMIPVILFNQLLRRVSGKKLLGRKTTEKMINL